jgi:hypothetical protein
LRTVPALSNSISGAESRSYAVRAESHHSVDIVFQRAETSMLQRSENTFAQLYKTGPGALVSDARTDRALPVGREQNDASAKCRCHARGREGRADTRMRSRSSGPAQFILIGLLCRRSLRDLCRCFDDWLGRGCLRCFRFFLRGELLLDRGRDYGHVHLVNLGGFA